MKQNSFFTACLLSAMLTAPAFADSRNVTRSLSGGSGRADIIAIEKAKTIQNTDETARAMPKLDGKEQTENSSKKTVRRVARSMSGGSGMADRISVHKE
ncbi:MAG: hypothetical protein K1X79_04245 [Oligoflexia bacterium]|nr:hypothetical protein [Oligoflexia bacterium]